ncbi:mannose-1-phosphate guanylyltransferase [Schistosoma bovis]|uniref:Mannose-1-phosphate guanylyltransferase n=1 Tax=Schistosoma bovis TaxID=6184 RepID=A0A430QSX0_SCHBO|nr:mannose-1-phosphate guanylyltransferase [Schistosoma bovis]
MSCVLDFLLTKSYTLICYDLRPSCKETIHLEREICQPLAGSGTLFVYHTNRFWSQIKFAGAVIYANRHILSLYERTHPHRLAKMSIPSSSNLQMLDDPINSSLVVMNGNCQPSICGPIIIGHVFIHPTASIDRTAVLIEISDSSWTIIKTSTSTSSSCHITIHYERNRPDKSAVIYANRHILSLYERTHPHRLAKMSIPSSSNLQMLDDPINSSLVVMNGNCQPSICGPIIIGHVFIHPTASIDRTAVIGPNVSIGERAVIQAGVRLRECIVLRDVEIRAHACCLNAVIGWNTVIGEWARVEGTPNDPNPNKQFTKLEVLPVFNVKGQLNPSITVIGKSNLLLIITIDG